MDCSWLWQFTAALLGLVVVYKLLDRIIRIPYIGRYADRCIFVTGCDTGFGNALVKHLDSLGCHVFAGCLTENGETELKKTCSDRVLAIALDVTKPDSVRKAFEIVSRTLAKQTKGLWAVVNNAGILGCISPHEWLQVDDYRRVCDVNLFGYIDVTMTFLPLIKRSRGRVVNVSSTAGRMVFPLMLPYSISKYGVEAFSDGLRRSLRPYGCRVGIIEPGGFKTNLLSSASLLTEATWNAATDEIKKEFGPEYYNFMISEYSKVMPQRMASDLSQATRSLVHAILGRYPRARYSPGLDSKLFLLLAALPEWMSDRMCEFLLPRKPLPAVLKTWH